MRERVVGLLLVAGCNTVYDLAPTALPSDARLECPPIGQTPRFDRNLHQAVFRPCDSYAYVGSRGQAIAVCDRASPTNELETVVEGGPIDGSLEPVDGIPIVPVTVARHGLAFASHDGERLYVRTEVSDETGTVITTIVIYVRQADGAWREDSTLPLTFPSPSISTIIDDAGRDRVLALAADRDQIDELVHDQTWSVAATHSTASELGVTGIVGISITSDGLRGVLVAGVMSNMLRLYYTDRPRLDAPFRTAELLDLPAPDQPFLTDDCARIYMPGLSSVFYAEQRL